MVTPTEKKPTPPLPHECCGGGSCCPCVWDSYYKKMGEWQASQGIPVTVLKPKPNPDEDFYR